MVVGYDEEGVFENRCCGMMMGVVCKFEELIFIGR